LRQVDCRNGSTHKTAIWLVGIQISEKISYSAAQITGSTMTMTKSYLTIAAIVFLGICDFTHAAENHAEVYERAVNHPDRSGAELDRDAARKPLEILPFTGITPGMTVLDMGAGGGYTTKLVARVVGEEGQVYAQALSGDPGLDNIVALPPIPLFKLRGAAHEAGMGASGADAILMFFTLHDMYLDSKIDKTRLYRDIYSLLKPGGVLVILDNAGVEGSGLQHTRSTHRIDRQFIIDELVKTKFRFDGQSDVLRNPDDDVTRSWGEYSPRGHHDRFALRFRKPAN
jgi:predicted methyltransferase